MDTRPDPGRLAAWRLFLTTYTHVVERLEADLAAARRLPLSWYDVLVQLDEAPERCLRIQELGRALAMSGSGLSRRVTRMEEAGLVERRPCDEDRRGVVVALNAAGEQELRTAAPLHLAGVEHHFTRHLTDAETVALGAAFARVLRAIDGPPRDESVAAPGDGG